MLKWRTPSGVRRFFAARGAVFGWRLAGESACFASGDILFVDSGKKYVAGGIDRPTQIANSSQKRKSHFHSPTHKSSSARANYRHAQVFPN
jgi:hypothetical protein